MVQTHKKKVLLICVGTEQKAPEGAQGRGGGENNRQKSKKKCIINEDKYLSNSIAVGPEVLDVLEGAVGVAIELLMLNATIQHREERVERIS